uniref:Uncharacterized protein n=1 Tax=Romanomermis culicivorax TaxID=13658 RepID=A0A915KBT3_ROMCU
MSTLKGKQSVTHQSTYELKRSLSNVMYRHLVTTAEANDQLLSLSEICVWVLGSGTGVGPKFTCVWVWAAFAVPIARRRALKIEIKQMAQQYFRNLANQKGIGPNDDYT